MPSRRTWLSTAPLAILLLMNVAGCPQSENGGDLASGSGSGSGLDEGSGLGESSGLAADSGLEAGSGLGAGSGLDAGGGLSEGSGLGEGSGLDAPDSLSGGGGLGARGGLGAGDGLSEGGGLGAGTGAGSGTGSGSDSGDQAGGGLAGSGLADRVSPSAPVLFVADEQSGLLSFKNPATLNGRPPPDTQIFSRFIVLDRPSAVGVDRFGDLLALTPSDGVAVIPGAEAATGDLNPTRRVSGPDTNLTHFSSTANSALAYDRDADRLFICNSSGVLVWDQFSTLRLDGNVAPNRIINSPDLFSPHSLALAPNGDLYVSSTRGVAVFENAAARDGNIPADRFIRILDETAVIQGSSIIVRDGIAVDGANRLYVLAFGLIFVLDNASELDGTVAPSRTIDIELPQVSISELAPEFDPAEIVIDSGGTGYVADQQHATIHIIPSIGSRTGTLPVGQTLSGLNANGLFLWE